MKETKRNGSPESNAVLTGILFTNTDYTVKHNSLFDNFTTLPRHISVPTHTGTTLAVDKGEDAFDPISLSSLIAVGVSLAENLMPKKTLI
ncbi:unnamed protein product [Pieris macdunnoughi]|uniref:Uncharacterized protein n=1 Tax=Pieris macdunnoughi TaxID=345717 RepID=A0A821UYU7_9NEOP|nr:unnamed protein product [Pieris macdunnoughi]